METAELKQWIRQAREAVQDEPDPYKLEAFKVILSRLIEHASISEILPEGAIGKKKAKVTLGKIPENILQHISKLTNKQRIQVLLYYAGKALTKEEIREKTIDLGVDEGWWNGSNFKRDLMKRSKLLVEEKDAVGVATYRLSSVARASTQSLLEKLS
ncbi:MAG: hypothetical protein HMLIMOIP_000347 [Candidatus Nitrosomirales archaeon]|jgi:hypothetical protein